jgi:hypothetical protein
MTGQLLRALPDSSTVTVYSCLSHQAPHTIVDQIIFRGKTITGLWLGPWLASNKNLFQLVMLWRRSQKLVGTDLKSEIRARYPFQDAREAVQEYTNQMSGGKILLTPLT